MNIHSTIQYIWVQYKYMNITKDKKQKIHEKKTYIKTLENTENTIQGTIIWNIISTVNLKSLKKKQSLSNYWSLWFRIVRGFGREDLTEGQRKLHNLYPSPDIIRTLRWAWLVAREKCVETFRSENLKQRDYLESVVKWKDIIEVDRKEGKHTRKLDIQTVILVEIRTGYFLDTKREYIH
jgi:hypothetical protein